MPVTNLPESDHVLRYVKYKLLRRDGDDNVVGCEGEVFAQRKLENNVSVTWQEYFDGNRAEQLKKAVEAFGKTWTVTPKSGFAVAGVRAIRKLGKDFNQKIRIVHEPTTENGGHAAIRRLPRDNIELLNLIATEAVEELVLSADLLSFT